MAQDPGDNTQIMNARTIDELVRWASLEQAADNILWIRKFGRSDSLAADTAEDVWSSGGIKELPYTAGQTMSVVSTSAADTSAGTGAQFVQISGLDTDYNLLSEVIVMNGTTPVVSSSSFITINRMRVVTSGSGQTNAGTITATGSTTSNVNATIEIGESITEQSHFTVPAGYTLFTLDVRFSVYRNTGGNATRGAEIDQYAFVPSINTQYQTIRIGASSGSVASFSPRLVANTPEKTTLWYRANADTNGTVVTTSASYLLVKGDYNLRTEI